MSRGCAVRLRPLLLLRPQRAVAVEGCHQSLGGGGSALALGQELVAVDLL